MFEGDMDDGELEIGQVAALVDEIKPAKDILDGIVAEFKIALEEFKSDKFKL
jgi:enoyl-[acyl-carrier protein] reductase II